MQISFAFEVQETGIFGVIKRPVAEVDFWSSELKNWVPVKMIVDSGADFTLLPLWLYSKLGIDLKKDCRKFYSAGVGGQQLVYALKKKWKVKIKDWESEIVLGFLNNNDVPPLLGRMKFIEDISVCFKDFKTTFTTGG